MLRVAEQQDQLVEIRTRIRHTTLLVLPAGEEILDFVVAMPTTGTSQAARTSPTLKPLEPEVKTNVALVCASGRIYSFLAEEYENDPHLVVRVERGEDKKSQTAAPHDPAFVSRTSIEGYSVRPARRPSRPELPLKRPLPRLKRRRRRPPARSTPSVLPTRPGCAGPTVLSGTPSPRPFSSRRCGPMGVSPT